MMMRITLLLAPALSLFAANADLILHNGKILTVDKSFTIAQAIAITGNKITAVGSDQDVLKQAGANTVKIDLKGRTVIPVRLKRRMQGCVPRLRTDDLQKSGRKSAKAIQFSLNRSEPAPTRGW